MAKGSRGGKYGAGGGGGYAGAPIVTPTQVTPPTPQQVAAGNVLPAGGVAFSDFQGMTDNEKADVITQALGVGLPVFLDDSGLQRFAYFTGMSDKPTMVTDAQLDGIKGKDIFRTVNDAYDPKTDIGYSSKDIAKQIGRGDFTMYSDSGGSAHGKAIYFAGSSSESSLYAGGSNRHPLMMRAKVTSGRVISESTLRTQYSQALGRGEKLALACSNADHGSARNLYALAKGFSVVHDSNSDYYMVLNRGALSLSSTAKDALKVRRSGW